MYEFETVKSPHTLVGFILPMILNFINRFGKYPQKILSGKLRNNQTCLNTRMYSFKGTYFCGILGFLYHGLLVLLNEIISV